MYVCFCVCAVSEFLVARLICLLFLACAKRGPTLRLPEVNLCAAPSPGELMTVISAREYLRIARLLQICVTFA